MKYYHRGPESALLKIAPSSRRPGGEIFNSEASGGGEGVGVGGGEMRVMGEVGRGEEGES